MAASDFILRKKPDIDGLDFAALRQEGINFSQELSGNLWTDYNLHDPGVTLLEQLCFALTELAYQADIPVADYLADAHGNIQYDEFGLLKPHEALPTAPVIPSDYCKLFLDAIPEIDRVSVTLQQESQEHCAGLYKIDVKLSEPITGNPFTPQQKQDIVKKVHEKYAEWRNLNEDIVHIKIEDATPCFLTGTVETTGKRNPAEVHADIFFQCARKISSNVRIDRYEDVFTQGASLTDIFTGPLTQHGHIAEAPIATINTAKVLDELSGLIAKIAGVKKVYDLHLVNERNVRFTEEELFSNSFYLRFPEVEEPQLSIYFNAGKTNNITELNNQSHSNYEKHLKKSKRYLQKLEFEYKAFRNNKKNASLFYSLPQAKTSTHYQYHSIQHHLPDIYGVGTAGVSHSATQERKISALQLKAYLYPLEQIMANFQKMLPQLKKIFSLQEQEIQTYFSDLLTNANIPHIETLYRYENLTTKSLHLAPAPNVSGDTQSSKVEAYTKKYDNAIDRKSRALDSLLALYGEEFSPHGLLAFNYYHRECPGLWIVENKVRYLKNILELSARRSGAFNSSAPHWDSDNLSSAQKKIAILLGLDSFSRVESISNVYKKYNIHLVKDDALLKDNGAIENASYIPYLNDDQLASALKWKYNPSKKLSLCDAMLMHGVNLDSYRIAEKNAEFIVYFCEGGKSVPLKTFAQKEKAIDYTYKFKKIITDVNVKSEHFFMVEHLLLRSRNRSVNASGVSVENGVFFGNQLSFVFPAWPVRFSNTGFRQFAEKLICNNLPSHIFPHIYWVDMEAMKTFEDAYKDWLEQLRYYEAQRFDTDRLQGAEKALDRSSETLIKWFESQHAQASHDYWV